MVFIAVPAFLSRELACRQQSSSSLVRSCLRVLAESHNNVTGSLGVYSPVVSLRWLVRFVLFLNAGYAFLEKIYKARYVQFLLQYQHSHKIH
jgi:hypothetical protein